MTDTTGTAHKPRLLYQRITTPRQLFAAIAIVLGTGLIERLMGRLIVSKSGDLHLWIGDPHSNELSQQIADWYTFSHVLHGFLFYGLLHLINKKTKWTPGFCLLLAIAIECAWEILENSPIIINRYRQTAAQDYFGDSILNSICDILFCTLGYLIARHLPVWVSVLLILLVELGMLLAIRDNLTLNILMLLYPFPGIKHWQMGA